MKILLKYEVEVEVDRERGDLYWKLKNWIERTEKIVNAKRTKTKTRIDALRLGGYLVQVATGLVRDIDVSQIESEIEKLEKEEKEAPRREEKEKEED